MEVNGEERSPCANFIKLSKSAWERVTVLLAAEESIGEGVGRRGAVLETLEGDLAQSSLPCLLQHLSATCPEPVFLSPHAATTSTLTSTTR